MVENTEINSQTAPVAETQTVVSNDPPVKKGITLGSIVIAFTLLGLLALAGVGYFLWDQLRSQQEGLGGNLDKGDKRIIELRKQINITQSQLSTAEKQLANLTETQNNKDQQYERLLKEQSKLHHDRLTNSHTQLEVKLSNIQKQLGKTRGDWLVADAEYLLSVANERLQLTQDIKTTIMALEAADHRLRESGDGGVFKVRAEIAGEISALKATNTPDIVGLINQLSILQKNIQSFQLTLPTMNAIPNTDRNRPTTVDNNNNSNGIESAVGKALTDLKELVIIRERDPNTITVLHPEEARVIREDLLIRLDIAKSALARRNETEFRSSLGSTKDWLNDHFDTNTKNVKTALKTINTLLKTKLRSQLPDISRSLKMLRDVTKFRLNADGNKSKSDHKSEPGQIEARPKKTGNSIPGKTGAAQ